VAKGGGKLRIFLSASLKVPDLDFAPSFRKKDRVFLIHHPRIVEGKPSIRFPRMGRKESIWWRMAPAWPPEALYSARNPMSKAYEKFCLSTPQDRPRKHPLKPCLG